MWKQACLSLFICFYFNSSFAQEVALVTKTDSATSVTEAVPYNAPAPAKEIKPSSFIMPAALIGAGAFTLVKEMDGINQFGKSTMWRDGYENNMKVDHFTIGIPALAVYGLNIAGIKGEHNLLDRTMLLAMSSAIANGVTFSTKHITGIPRPNDADKMSFPSGHTAEAFVAAEFMRLEYKNVSPWYGVAAYAIAAGNGLLRMYHNKHWLGDVVAGAGLGILSTRVSYWLYPKIKEKFSKKKDTHLMITPAIATNSIGATLLYSF